MITLVGTYKSTAAAASSGVAPRPSGIPGAPAPPPVAADLPPGMPSATFLPSISISAPASLAAVSLQYKHRAGSESKSQTAEALALCAAPLALVLWQSAADFIETQQQQQEAAESNPYLNL